MNEEPTYQTQPAAAPMPMAEPVTHAPHGAGEPEPSVPVVKVYSVKGVEYGLMSFMVWFGGAALIWCLLALIEGEASFSMLAFPVALLLCSLPIFAYLFLRLRKGELADPKQRFEPTKRRFSQLTQFLSFFVVFSSFVQFVYTLVAQMGGQETESLAKSFGGFAVVLAVAGGIFAYYWMDEHRGARRTR